MEKWTAGQLAAAVDRTARAGGRSTARDEALALVECVRQELGAGASVEEVAAAAVRRATPGGSNVVRVARVKGGEVVLGVNPEVLREVCRMLKAGAGNEAQSARAEYTFAVEVLDAEEAVAAEFGQAATSQLSAGHAARLVVGWIRERAATTDNKSMMPLLKKLGVVKNEQFQLQFLSTFFPTGNRGGRREPRDAPLDALLDALEQGCEALLARGGYTRGGERPFLLDVQEALHLLTVAAKHASSDEEGLQELRVRLLELEGAATDEKRLKKLLSFRKSAAAAEADDDEQEAAVGLTSHVQSALGPEAFRRLAGEAMASVVDRLAQGDVNASVLKVLDAVFVCAAKLVVAGDEEASHHEEDGAAGELGRLKELHAEWRAARRRPAQRGAAQRRSFAAAAAVGTGAWVALSQERSSSKRTHDDEVAASLPVVADGGADEPSQSGGDGQRRRREREASQVGGAAAGSGGAVEPAESSDVADAVHALCCKKRRRAKERAGGGGELPAREKWRGGQKARAGGETAKTPRAGGEAARRPLEAQAAGARGFVRLDSDFDEPRAASPAGGGSVDADFEAVAAPVGPRTGYLSDSSSEDSL